MNYDEERSIRKYETDLVAFLEMLDGADFTLRLYGEPPGSMRGVRIRQRILRDWIKKLKAEPEPKPESTKLDLSNLYDDAEALYLKLLAHDCSDRDLQLGQTRETHEFCRTCLQLEGLRQFIATRNRGRP